MLVTSAIDRMSGSLFLVAVGGAEIGPVDIGAEVFAADSAFGGALDGWAAFGWNGPPTLDPFIDGRRFNAEQSGHRRLAASDFTSPFDSFFLHAANYKARPYPKSIGIA